MKTNLIDRDLSWLSFNRRILEEAADPEVLLFDRIQFLAIYSSNLDEFFSVRIAHLKQLISIGKKKINKALNVKPEEQLEALLKEVGSQLEYFGTIFREGILPELDREEIHLYFDEAPKEEHLPAIKSYFKSKVLSYLQPIIVDEDSEEKVFLENGQIYMVVRLESELLQKERTAYLKVPTDHLNRFFQLPAIGEIDYFIFLEDIIKANLSFVFPQHIVKESHCVKISRDADLYIEDEWDGDLIDKIRKHLSKRKDGIPSRFLYDRFMSDEFLGKVQKHLGLQTEELVSGGRYHNFKDFFGLPNPKKKQLSLPRPKALEVDHLENAPSLFDAIDHKDQMLHFPYQSYDYILRFFNEAAIHPKVKSIRASLYRVASNSHIVNALISAARNGKKVEVFVEAKARFDEANNLKWSDKMVEAGVQIFYSFPQLKVHAKIALITKENADGDLEDYAFLGTGNLNEKTASIYADEALLTKDTRLTSDLTQVFDLIFRHKEEIDPQHLLVAPNHLQSRLEGMIEKEIQAAQEGKTAKIVIKLNNLQDPIMINLLYKAADAGVAIDLIIRGICCLIPNEKIKVHRVVGQFLEHSRIYYFHNEGESKLYLSSSDWMERNLYRRIEVAFPVLQQEHKEELLHLMNLQLRDNIKGRILDSEHNNLRKESDENIHSQRDYYLYLKEKNSVCLH